MLDEDTASTPDNTPDTTTSEGTPATPPAGSEAGAAEAPAPAKRAAAKRTATKKAATKKAATKKPADADAEPSTPAKKTTARKTAAKKTAAKTAAPTAEAAGQGEESVPTPPPLLFQAPPEEAPAAKKAAAKKAAAKKTAATQRTAADKTTDRPAPASDGETGAPGGADGSVSSEVDATEASQSDEAFDALEGGEGSEGAARRRRRRGGRRRRKPAGTSLDAGDDATDEDDDEAAEAPGAGDEGSNNSRRRRVRARAGEAREGGSDDPANTVTRVRTARSSDDEIAGFTGSTRLEAKKQRRREGREAGRRRAPIISEAEFLARRESVDRVMVVRQRVDLTQIAVLEDNVLVEHYVARESQTSLIGNVYLGRVQNVLPSMEAAFIDIGKGRNAVLYAGEVSWEALGAKDGSQRKIEAVLKPGQPVLVQVTKDPIGHKGARLTSQVSLPGRFLVYVPDGTTSGISRKLPDTERNRLKSLLKEIVPDTAGVIVRTAAEGASEDELTRDVERLKVLWEGIAAKVESGNAPQLLYGEPDLMLKVVRDLFTEDFAKLVVSGDEAWETVSTYVDQVAPDLAERLERHSTEDGGDAFSAYRIDEQIAKGLDRKVWLPSGGSLVIDRTEAMTVVDVNTGKFTGSGGNLEETVTKNNLEAAEEIVRQLRLRDIGGIIVVDFIDMVLESNRDLVLRRLVECLGRDRTRHQVAEVTSLGLVQMTRKRIGTGLLEAFSETCDYCQGRGVVVHHHPIEPKRAKVEEEPRRSRRNRGRGRGAGDDTPTVESTPRTPTPAEFAAMARHEARVDEEDVAEFDDIVSVVADAAQLRPATDDALADSYVAAESVVVPDQEIADETPEPEPEPDPEPEPEPVTEPVTEPVVAAEPEPEPAIEPEPAPPAGPVITTSVRRVSARRPAGPPTPATEAGDEEPRGEADGVEFPDLVPTAAHVPIKKRGARKR